MFKKAPIICLALSLLSGCGGYGNPDIANKDYITEIQKGKSTKEDVRKRFGEPQTVSDTNGLERWVYINTDFKMKPETYIPIAGIFLGGSTSKSNTLAFDFDPSGIVVGIDRTNTKSEIDNMKGMRMN